MSTFYGCMCIVTTFDAKTVRAAFANDQGPNWDFGARLIKCLRDKAGGQTVAIIKKALEAINHKWCIDKSTLDAAKTFPGTLKDRWQL